MSRAKRQSSAQLWMRTAVCSEDKSQAPDSCCLSGAWLFAEGAGRIVMQSNKKLPRFSSQELFSGGFVLDIFVSQLESKPSAAGSIRKGGARERADDVLLFRRNKRTSEQSGLCSDVAEMEGFEPPRRFHGLPHFECGPFSHLGTSPDRKYSFFMNE